MFRLCNKSLQSLEMVISFAEEPSVDDILKDRQHRLEEGCKDDCEDDIIIEEVKKGYVIEDKLLRPSQVIVAKKKEKC